MQVIHRVLGGAHQPDIGVLHAPAPGHVAIHNQFLCPLVDFLCIVRCQGLIDVKIPLQLQGAPDIHGISDHHWEYGGKGKVFVMVICLSRDVFLINPKGTHISEVMRWQ